MWFAVVRKAQFVQDAQLVVVVESGGGKTRGASQRLLLLYIVCEFAQGLWRQVRFRA